MPIAGTPNPSVIGAHCSIEAAGRKQFADVVSGGSYFFAELAHTLLWLGECGFGGEPQVDDDCSEPDDFVNRTRPVSVPQNRRTSWK